jgi:hypothetical protein
VYLLCSVNYEIKIFNVLIWLTLLKFVHEISADIIKFVCSSAELVHKMLMLYLCRLWQCSYQGAVKDYVLLANTIPLGGAVEIKCRHLTVHNPKKTTYWSLKMKTLRFFKTSGTIHTTTQQICIFFDIAGRTSKFAHHRLVLFLSPEWPDSAVICKTRIELKHENASCNKILLKWIAVVISRAA